MILDERNEFADAVALATAIGTGNLGDVIDLGSARNVGLSRQMYAVIQITTAVTSAGAATVAFQVVSDGAAVPDTAGTQTIHVASQAIGKASLVAGYTVVLPLPPEGDVPYEQYLGVQSVVGVAALTAGAANAFLTLDPTGWKSYPDAAN